MNRLIPYLLSKTRNYCIIARLTISTDELDCEDIRARISILQAQNKFPASIPQYTEDCGNIPHNQAHSLR